jgi:uncharacterized protein (DUF2132 family)
MSFQQKPSIGRVVHFLRGTQVKPSPAIVTYVHSDVLVNVTVFKDCAAPDFATSVKFVETEAEARDVVDLNQAGAVAFWPPRV